MHDSERPENREAAEFSSRRSPPERTGPGTEPISNGCARHLTSYARERGPAPGAHPASDAGWPPRPRHQADLRRTDGHVGKLGDIPLEILPVAPEAHHYSVPKIAAALRVPGATFNKRLRLPRGRNSE